MPAITEDPLDVDRNLRTRLQTLARTTRIEEVEHAETEIGEKREIKVDMPNRAEVHVHETVGAGRVFASARPPSSAAYLALLMFATTWGQPTTVYEDQLPDTEYADVTAVWITDGTGEDALQHLLAHTDRGYDWEPLDQDEWIAKARPALEGS